MRPPKSRLLQVSTLWIYRAVTAGVLAAGLSFGVIVLGLRYWILPNIESYREDIERIVSERARQTVTIGKINANWDGLRPQLLLERVTIYDAAGRPALELPRIDHTLSWLSLVTFELRFHALDIHRPILKIRRDARGVISIAGIELAGEGDGGGFADWLLRQRDTEVLDATILWLDEQRGAPLLELKQVNLQIFSRGGHHRFGLRAVPPQELAAPLDVRGDFTGETTRALADWNGKLFLRLDYADIAAWRTWIPFPVEFPRGAGALRAWLTFSRHQLVDAIADVRLANVRTRLAPDLPELNLVELAGRVGWKNSEEEFEITTSRLGLTTTGGLTMRPADFLLRLTSASRFRPAHGELQANALELAPLATLADHLPLAQEVRKELAAFSPKGSLHDVVVRWNGEWREPREYSARGRFHNLALNPTGKIPGFTGVSGNLTGDERGGLLQLNSKRATVDMPLVFREALEFDTLTAQIAWTRSGGETELKLNYVSFINSHLAGRVSGNYRTAGDTSGNIDLTGNLTHADAGSVSRYIPVTVAKSARPWLDAAFAAGRSNNVSLRVRGNLDEFPFPDGKGGLFQVTTRVTGGTLDYANGWPRIENIAGDVIFRGKRMDVHARQGTILGVGLVRVFAEIPDLLQDDRTLNITGEAEGPTSQFLAFIEGSPVLGMVDRFTERWQAQGWGRLALKLTIPLGDPGKSTVTGAYQFSGNKVAINPDLPAIEQASGRIEFTESAVRAQNVGANFLGGPVTISAITQRDSAVRVAVKGRVNADNARRAVDAPNWMRELRGSTDWRALITLRRPSAEVVIESNLQGLAADLPAPLKKSAVETLPFRFERRSLAADQERLSLSFGDILRANLVRRTEDRRTAVVRGTVRFGGAAAAEPDRSGVWVSGAVKALDVDQWLKLLGQTGGESQIDWGGVDLKIGTLDALGLRFSELAVNATAQDGQWRGNLLGKELDGSIAWQPQGRGKLTARMKTLTLPAAAPGADQAAGASKARKDPELPAFDVTAEQFTRKDRHLGRLEFNAVPEGRNWRIEKLNIVNPESTVTLDGLWHASAKPSSTQVNLRVETTDIGKLLARFGHPEGVRRGTAKLEGTLSWAGAPFDFDYPTLSGNLALEAAKGQFVKLEPGIGKLLGIVSLQALPRRITLDFRDVFTEGLAFDEIVGAVAINQGVASTENFRIQGPAARVIMSGNVDLARETQTLKVRITPQLSDSVSIAGALLGGPVAGVATFLAQKVLKDPLGRIASYDYNVTGPWSEPNVVKIERSPVNQEAGEAKQ